VALHFDNFCEVVMRVLKDKIFLRSKAFNVSQLLDFLTTRMEVYYQQKLIDVANNRTHRLLQSRFYKCASCISAESIKQMSEHTFEVASEKEENKVYTVDMSVGFCSCPVGQTGGPCKHQFAIIKTFNLASWNFVPINSMALRQMYYSVAVGENNIPSHWFAPRHSSQQGGHASLPQRPQLQTAEPLHQEMECDGDRDGTEAEVNEMDPSDDEDMSQVGMNTDSRVKELKEVRCELETIAQELAAKASDTPETLKYVQCFIQQYKHIQTSAALSSALRCFGKYSGAPSLRQSKRLKALRNIGVQPTAVARRKMLVGGRRRAGLGRPRKNVVRQRDVSHGTLKGHVLPRRKAPHCISDCVANNMALGKNHQAK
jgi:hypothetical protein